MPIQCSDHWQDYEFIDGNLGMKYERWGDVKLVRPDPLVLWPSQSEAPWSNYDGWYHRSSKGGGHWDFQRSLPASWKVHYRNLRFIVRPTDFKHTGLFPEQAVNWDWFMPLIKESAEAKLSVLNLFGYTGGATIAAARAGAEVCHVDAAKGMVNWCRENAQANNLEQAPIRYIVDDCMKFVQREGRRGNRYHGIIMDPPSYGRGKNGEIWKLEKNLWELLVACREILSTDARFFLINSYTTGVSPTVLANMLQDIVSGMGGSIYCGEVGLTCKSDGKALPCGIFCRWVRQDVN
nr:class I SAM-dependent methyltransferase [Desulfurispira natronophila]